MSPNRTAEWGTGMRPPAIALLWGALAGGAAALVYTAMNAAQHVIWPDDIARWYIPLIVLAGGGLIALLRPHTDDGSPDDQLTAAADPRRLRRERTAALALSAIIAYGFGGASGPAGGLVAVAQGPGLPRPPHPGRDRRGWRPAPAPPCLPPHSRRAGCAIPPTSG